MDGKVINIASDFNDDELTGIADSLVGFAISIVAELKGKQQEEDLDIDALIPFLKEALANIDHRQLFSRKDLFMMFVTELGKKFSANHAYLAT